jgi:phosphoribosyl 1,2-cyclic phosphodiesterase
MLVHDCQYTDTEYPNHLGWGHSPMSDALEFGHRVAADQLLLFHHDPLHSDTDLDGLAEEVELRWRELGRSPEQVELAAERRELDLQFAGEPARTG